MKVTCLLFEGVVDCSSSSLRLDNALRVIGRDMAKEEERDRMVWIKMGRTGFHWYFIPFYQNHRRMVSVSSKNRGGIEKHALMVDVQTRG